jgi:hypothetical protein
MGEVWRADDLKLGQPVALKLLSETVGQNETRLTRLLNEVRVARQVSHPNVCRVHDVAEDGGLHFLSMELVEGADLAGLLKAKGRIPKDEAISIARQVALGLAAAHDQGVLHRDLKPSNVMVDRRGIARITDFGLAEASEAIRDARAAEGTPFYMSPEQLEGREATAASDLYALGLLLHELFTGERVFEASSAAELRRLRKEPPKLSPRLDRLDRTIGRTIRRCLEIDPALRPASGRIVASSLPAAPGGSSALEAAQQRADRIAAFRAELAELRRDGVVRLDDTDLAGLERHHAKLLRDLVDAFDVDVDEEGKRLSLGMRAVSFLGALAFGASVFYFFHRVWGLLPVSAQVAILVSAPLLALLGTSAIAARERSGDFAFMAAFLALVAFATDISVLGAVFEITPSPGGVLAVGLFALVLAFGFRLRLLFGAGLVLLSAVVAAYLTAAAGGDWSSFMERPEGFLPAGAALLLLPRAAPLGGRSGFSEVSRGIALVLLAGPAIILSALGILSYLPMDRRIVEATYGIVGLAICAAAIGLGIAWRHRETIWVGAALLVVLLFTLLSHWTWDWIPRYLFFFLLAVVAAGVVWLLRRLRSRVEALDREVRP